ncbi:SAUR-like auxin-responsive protein family [Striga hermonthica]|uniref:SAUR-like auxin-responsive protein family n=1 Tax=Striga hermonthica TaxID=68872 RepID=A0A9N7R5X2_STRHE|nr:SAUR-like auxin-responsive protein family [Striga hermonthica]
MGKTRTKGNKKNGRGIVKIKEKLQRSLISGLKLFTDECDNQEIRVPDDVKEGHFAVIAEDNHELRRFVVPLSFLTHPSFVRLLEQAAEEYGFDRGGALTVPCKPVELEHILSERWVEEEVGFDGDDNNTNNKWSLCNKAKMVKSH